MAAAYSWFLALRYLLARWVNVLGIAGVAVAVWALIVVIAVFSGFIYELRSHIRTASADLVLTGVDANTSFAEIDAVLRRDPDVAATAPRLTHYAILFPYGRWGMRPVFSRATGTTSLQRNVVSLVGLDPTLEREATGFADWLRNVPTTQGQAPGQPPLYRVPNLQRPFDVPEELHKFGMSRAGLDVPSGPMISTGPGVLLSYNRMTGYERMPPGQLLDLVSARFVRRAGAEDKVVKLKLPCVVNGAFETKYRDFDDSHAFLDIDVLRSLLGHDPDDFTSIDLVDEVVIRVREGADPLAVQRRLNDAVRDTSGGRVLTWEEQNAQFLSAVDHERGMMKVVLFAVMVVASFLIYATLHMMVMHKVKDIGILSALGATPNGVAAIFSICGLVIATIGCALGAVGGILSAHYLNDVNDWTYENFGIELFSRDIYLLPRIPYRIEADWVVQVLIAAFLLVLFVAWFPARRAARMHPVEALSYE